MGFLRLLPTEIIFLVLKGGSLVGENTLKSEDGIRREWGILMDPLHLVMGEKPRRKAGARTDSLEFLPKKLEF